MMGGKPVVACVTVLVVTAVVVSTSGMGDARGVVGPTEIDSCTEIEEPGEYVLTDDIYFNEETSCIYIQSSDVRLDGNGHDIQGGLKALTGGTAIRAADFDRLSNVTVTNVSVTFVHDAIKFQGVTDGRIAEASVTDSRYGIRLLRYSGVGPTREVAVEDNRISNSTYDGIAVMHSTDNTVAGNTVTGNERTGIRLENATDTTITDNVASANEDGVYLVDADNAALTSNTVSENSQNGIEIEESTGATLVDNTATDNSYGIVVRGGGTTFTDNIARRNNFAGIFIDEGGGNTLEDNTASENGEDGIWLGGTSNDNTVAGNTANGNDRFGILLSGDDNSLTDNTASENGRDGISLAESSNENTVADNSANGNEGFGILLGGDDNILSGNTASENGDPGIRISGDDNTITDNTVTRNRAGISLSGANNVLTGTTATENEFGIYLVSTDNATVTDNIASENELGIVLFASDEATLEGNTADENENYGIGLEQASRNTIVDTSAEDNGLWDFYSLDDSVDNRVVGLTLDSGTTVSFLSRDVGIRGVDSPPADPDGFGSTGAYVNATNTSEESWLLLNVSYTEAALSGRDEATLRLWRYEDDGTWAPVDSEVNAAERYVSANLTDPGVFAPFAELVPPSIETDPAATLAEGDSVTSPVTITDSDSAAWTATVDYGDGSPPAALELDDTEFALEHTYAEDGTYTVTIDVCDDWDLCTNETRRVTVENVPPTVEASATNAPPDEPVSLDVSFTDPGEADTHTVEVTWGDGTGESIPVNERSGASTVTASHTFGEAGTYEITVRVIDDDGGVDTATITVYVGVSTPTESVAPTESAPPTAGTATASSDQGVPVALGILVLLFIVVGAGVLVRHRFGE